MKSEHTFDSSAAGAPHPATGPLGVDDNVRALMETRVDEALARLLDDLRRWTEAHAEASGEDHFGHVSKRNEALQQHEVRMAEQRAAAGPERTRQVQRWAQHALRQSREFQAQRPRRATARDFALALSSALRKAENHQHSGTPVPAAADLVAAVADQVIIRPEPDPEAGKIGVIAIPDDESLAAYNASGEAEADIEQPRARPAPLSAATRRIAAQRILALITCTAEQIERVLDLAALLPTNPEADQRDTGPIGSTSRDPEVVLAVTVEIQRLRAADYTRRHEEVMRAWAASPQTDTPQE